MITVTGPTAVRGGVLEVRIGARSAMVIVDDDDDDATVAVHAWIAMWCVIYADEREESEMPWDLGGES